MMKKLAEDNLINYLKENNNISSREDLFNYFQKTEGELNEGTFGWRVYSLKKKGILREIKRGLYILDAKSRYKPDISEDVKKLASIINRSYSYSRYCVWDINWLNEFTLHQFTNRSWILDIDKDQEESVAHTLSVNGYLNFIGSKGNLASVISPTNFVIVLPLITRAPVQTITTEDNLRVSIPTLEKILVDIYDDQKVFGFIQGAEIERIFENALKRYTFNYTTFFAYAKRRGKEQTLHDFLDKHFPELVKDFV